MQLAVNAWCAGCIATKGAICSMLKYFYFVNYP